jgi:hypothetical protein
MGGASTAAPIQGYNQNLFSGLNLTNGVTNATIAAAPVLQNMDINGLQTMVGNESLKNALDAAAREQQLTPDIAATRAGLSKQVNEDLNGGPSVQLSNEWLKQGLGDTIATGANADGTFARSALADTTRQDYYQNRDAQQAKAASLLSANPLPVTGLDPGTLASYKTGVESGNTNALNNYTQNVLGALGNESQNVMNGFQQAMQMEAARRSGASSANNAMSGSMLGLGGAGIGAAGAIGGGLIAF